MSARTVGLAFAAAVAAVAVAGAAPAAAASFDCAGARTAVEIRICADADLGAKDEAMAYLYGRGRAAGGDPSLRRTQREWLARRNRCADAACLRDSYDARIRALRRHDPDLIYGRFESGHGQLSLVQTGPGELAFHLLAVRPNGPGANVGEAAGRMAYAGGAADYITPGGHCELRLRRDGDGWTVAQAGHCDFGLGVTADGVYRPAAGQPVVAPV